MPDRVRDDELRRWRWRATERLAAVTQDTPDAAVPAYPGWRVRELALHVAGVFGNAALALRDGELERPRPQLPVTAADGAAALASALRDGLRNAEDELERCRHEVVWTPTGPRPPAFWKRRLLREAVLHRWDADDAAGNRTPPTDMEALQLLDEFLDTDVRRALDAGEYPPGGLVVFRSAGRTWQVDLAQGSVAHGPTDAAQAAVGGEPEPLWLWLMRRDPLPGRVWLDDDEHGSLAAFVELIDGFRRPTD